MSERREHFRTSVNWPAELGLPGSREVYGCTVLDKSDGGVQVDLDEDVEIPEHVTIRFSDGASQLVRRCWFSGSRAGFQFIEAMDELNAPAGLDPLDREGAEALTADHVRIVYATLGQSGEGKDMQCSSGLIHAFFRAQPRMEMASGTVTGAEVARLLDGQHAGMPQIPPAEALLNFFGAKWQKFLYD